MNYEYELKGDIFNEIKLRASLLDFWLNVIMPELKLNFNNEPLNYKFLLENINLENEERVNFYIQLKIKNSNNNYYSISFLQLVNSSDFNKLFSTLIEFYELKDEYYKTLDVTHIVYTYKIIDNKDKLYDNVKLNKLNKVKKKEIKTKPEFKVLGYALPPTMDFTEWGVCIFDINYKKAIVYKKNSKVEYHIEIELDRTNVKYMLNDVLLFNFTDYVLDFQNLNSFKRVLKNQSFYYELGKLKLKQKN